ncbi:hypothetical protein BA768_18825 [Chryseobacterium sp. CBo1]|uniref:Crp/Fnr family transcriptional regulator n=1 Tax=Chryseobacterium TaxID=59732 RepID=UPI000810B091|nr:MULTISPECIES: Crp/Fnr family transcriptional regulator [Chryseobacterium]OCK50773.1 hypothetical protein BA768_18825 [Chryseobacterium sp. CBo1]
MIIVIDEQILISLGAELKHYAPGNIIFSNNSFCKYYFQIKKGTVKLCNTGEDGKELVHGFPFEGHCFGESYLFTDLAYAMDAVSLEHAEILILEKNSLLQYLVINPTLILKINQYTAERLHFRYLISSFLITSNPAVRLTKLFDHLKQYFGNIDQFSFKIPYTKHQISCVTGLRTETVIRTLKKCRWKKN